MIDIATGNHHACPTREQGLNGRHCLFCEEVNLINGHEIVHVL